jgi:16S rRNA processing protein RimM
MDGEWFEIGKVHKTHGLAGELKMSIGEAYLPIALEKGYLILRQKGSYIPVFLEGIRGQSPHIVKLESFDSLEEVAAFAGSPVYLRKGDVPEILADAPVDADEDSLAGYTLINEKDQVRLEIVDIREYPMQTMLVASMDGEEVLIPFVPAWVVRKDDGEKAIYMHLPEGLY